MCDPITVLASAAVGGLATSVYQGERQRKAASRAADQARTAADRQFNAQNQKKPNVSAIAADNMQAAGAGVGSTMLTGAGGAPAGNLGAVSLLGG